MNPRAALIALPLALFAPDALAWGLQTHLFFAQYVLAVVPFADPELRAAALRLPRVVLAGACLPDLGIVGQLLGTPAFRRAHLWSTLRRVATAPRSETERALAIGYASHLLSDVTAHNLFVPEYERRIGKTAMVAHLGAEWAMDQHLRAELQAHPGSLLREFRREAIDFVCRALPCGQELAARALGALELALRGGFEDWSGSDPEGSGGNQAAEGGAGEHIARIVQAEHHA